MNRPRFTIGHLMLAILVIAVNAGLIRAFFLQGMFSGVILLFFAMQVGLFLLLHSKGRARCFWVGFGGAGIAVVLALFLCDLFEDSAFTRCVSLYQMLVEDALVESPQMPASVAEFLMNHPDLLDAAVFFPPEFVIASLGGCLAILVDPGPRRRGPGARPPGRRCPQPSNVLTSNHCNHR